MIRLPFVSRAAFDAASTRAEEWKALHTDAMNRANRYMDTILELKRTGYDRPESLQAEEPVMPPEILMRAIREVSPTQDHAYHMNYQWAMALKDHWTDEGKMREAAQQIRYGSAYTPDTDDA